jgi:hypothetical protein
MPAAMQFIWQEMAWRVCAGCDGTNESNAVALPASAHKKRNRSSNYTAATPPLIGWYRPIPVQFQKRWNDGTFDKTSEIMTQTPVVE